MLGSTVFGADYMGGVVCADKPIEAHFIAQSGAVMTNFIASGENIVMADRILELVAKQPTKLSLSGGTTIEMDADSVMAVSVFDQEVKNQKGQPALAVFGFHNISFDLTKGKFFITYIKQDSNSTCEISTTTAVYQPNVGKFLFNVTEDRSTVCVLDGSVLVHGDKNRVDTTTKGNKTITGRLDTELATTTRPLNTSDNSIIAQMQTSSEASAAIDFVVIEGRVWGVRMDK